MSPLIKCIFASWHRRVTLSWQVSLLWLMATPLLAQITNQVPNPELRGNQGVVASDMASSVTGSVPSGWRGFAVNGADIVLSSIELPAGTLFAGSPAVTAVRLETIDFGPGGSDSGLDHTGSEFSLFANRSYSGTVYLRSANADNSAQQLSVSMPIFDQDGDFTGLQPGSFNANVGSNWTRFSGPAFTGIDDFSSLIAFRLSNDGGDNAVLIALPEVAGPVLANRLPNPDLAGTDGFVQGNVSGDVPDDWRAFAIDGASLDINTVPLAASAVFPGSPASNAVDVSVVTGAGFTGFDHEPTQVALTPTGYLFRPRLYMRSSNNNGSAQTVVVNTPVFDSNGFTGRTPGIFSANVDNQWRLYVGPTFSELAGTTLNMAIAVVEDGGEDSVQIAFPTLLGVDVILADGFE
ncbi:MAG: hypothetical protein Tsb0027_23870 [Wenzhouxiangellaceae bacterium]